MELPTKEGISEAFSAKYNQPPIWITRSPGRVNIIGEHTDYNDGFVLPMTIHHAAWVALRPRDDNQVRIMALDIGEELTFNLEDFKKGRAGWREYVKGVAWALQEEDFALRGWEGILSGDVPIAAGLSSSAALELALARAFALASDLAWDAHQAALTCQKAENHWVGVNSGIMDQMISAAGKENSALLIDCRDLETRLVPLPEKGRIVILDTATRRDLVDSAYNERRSQCEAVALQFGLSALRDINLEQLQDRAGELDPVLYKRAKHVISENQRVLDAVQALQEGNLIRLGELMNASHVSLRDDFQVSREEMDQMVAVAQTQPGCFGARLTGAGFGGCAIALVKIDHVNDFQSEVAREYRRRTGLKPDIYPVHAVNGTSYEEG